MEGLGLALARGLAHAMGGELGGLLELSNTDIGKNLIDLKDVDGKAFVKERVVHKRRLFPVVAGILLVDIFVLYLLPQGQIQFTR